MSPELRTRLTNIETHLSRQLSSLTDKLSDDLSTLTIEDIQLVFEQSNTALIDINRTMTLFRATIAEDWS